MWTQVQEGASCFGYNHPTYSDIKTVLQLLHEKTGLTKILKFSAFTDGETVVIQLNKQNAVLKTDLWSQGQLQWRKSK